MKHGWSLRRIPLRVKLVAAVLALVTLALVVISVPALRTSWLSSSSSMSAKVSCGASVARCTPWLRRSTARMRASTSSRLNGLVT